MLRSTRNASRTFDVASQFVFTVLGRGSFLALQVFLARQLGPLGFGLYSLGWTVVGLVGTVALAGMPQAVIRYGIGGRGALTSRAMVVTAIVGLAATLLVAAGADLIAEGLFAEPGAGPVIRALSPTILLGALGIVMASSLRVTGAVFLSALSGTAASVLGLILTVAVFAVWASAVSAAAVQGAAAALGLAVAAWLLGREASTPQSAGLGPLLRFGLITTVIHGSNVLNVMADRVVLGIMADAESVGVYQVAAQFAMVVVVLRSAVTTVFEARVPKQSADGSAPDVTREFFAATRILLHASGPGLVVLALAGGFLVRLLFGNAYAGAEAALVVLVLGQLATTFLGPSVTALHMTGEERLVLWLTFGSMVLNVACGIALIPVLGTVGAASASVIANLIVSGSCLVVLARSGRLRFSLVHLRDIAAATAACALVCWAVTHVAGAHSIASVGLMLVLAYLTYGIVVAATCKVEDEVLAALRSRGLRLLRRAGR